MRPGQIGVEAQIQARWLVLDRAQDQVLDGIVADGTPAQGLGDGGMDHFQGEALQQPQELNIFALAGLAQACLQEPVELLEGLRQLPAPQGGGLIQRPHFLLEQRQIMQRIEDEVLALIGAPMAGDHLGSAADDHFMDVATHQHLAMTIGDRHRVVVAAVAHQGERAHACAHPLAGIVGRCR